MQIYAANTAPTRPIPNVVKSEGAWLAMLVIAPPFPVVEDVGEYGRTPVELESGGIATGGANGEPAAVHWLTGGVWTSHKPESTSARV